MKHENNWAIMTEFIYLRAMMFAVRVNDKDIKKTKDVKNNDIVRKITHGI